MKKISIFIALLLWLPLGFSGAALQNGYNLFQKALVLERADGKLQEAITLYRQVVSESQDESLAAKAQLQIGICFEKLGQSEARAAYQTVIDKYPQQLEAVKEAKERISRLADTSETVANKPKFRKITIPFKLSWFSRTPNGSTTAFGARLSPDGKELAFGSEGSIWVVQVPGNVSQDIAGEPRRLTEAMYAMGGGISWSGDGSLIAFNAATSDEYIDDIYIVPSKGGEPTKLTSRKVAFGVPNLRDRLSLSPDGGTLAFQAKYGDGFDEGVLERARIQTITRGAASVKVLTDTRSAQPAFSPDGRWIAYINYSPWEIRVIPASGGESVRVADTSNKPVMSPVWSPDGSMLAFLIGQDEIWIVPVSEDGHATAAPTSFKRQENAWYPLAGWTSDNKIGLILGGDEVDKAIYSVPASGGKVAQVTPSGFFFHPRWSPDGERIWFLNGSARSTLGSVPSSGGAVSNLQTGSVQETPPGGGNVISPDGKQVVFAGSEVGKDGKFSNVGLWIMPLEGGEAIRLTEPLQNQQDRYPCWSHDGKVLFFTREQYPQESADIYTVSAEGGEARPITSASDQVTFSSVACSPDGKWIAYFSRDSSLSEGKSVQCIKIKPIDGGPARLVTRVHHLSGHEELCWSPDSTLLAYSSNTKIWMVPVNGGEPEQVATGLASLYATNLSWSPDGRTFAFVGSRIVDPELWLMEDFLPLVTR
jgi:Tol biopolymer transport system component